MQNVFGSISANTGTYPFIKIAVAVADIVQDEVIISEPNSSSGSAAIAASKPLVQELNEIQFLLPKNLLALSSKFLTWGPPKNCGLRAPKNPESSPELRT
jgi:hypothetical protein